MPRKTMTQKGWGFFKDGKLVHEEDGGITIYPDKAKARKAKEPGEILKRVWLKTRIGPDPVR